MDDTAQRLGTAIPFGQYNGQTVSQVLLQNKSGAFVKILNWGAVICDLRVPLSNGSLQRVVLGFDRFEDYPKNSPYFGALVGRCANRIGGGGFSLNGKRYDLVVNEGDNTCLHGGPEGFSHRIWQIDMLRDNQVTLSLVSQDGDMGFPGEVRATCCYTLTDNNELVVETAATANADTYVNLAQHSYFTLDGSGGLQDHELTVHSNTITPFDAEGIPLGGFKDIKGTALDYSTPRNLGELDAPDLDHNYVLDGAGDALRDAAVLTCRSTGLALSVRTTKPGMQVYNASKLDIAIAGLDGERMTSRAAICLETQYFPDAPNRPWAASALVTPTQPYAHRTEYKFSTI